MGKLTELMLSVTNNCNLRCKMCDIPRSFKTNKISTKDFEHLFEDFSQIGTHKKSIVISGGEPMTRRDIFEIISIASSYGIFTYMPSNGTLITKDAASNLRKSGIDVVNISIEGPNEIHDRLRGVGSFKRAISAIKILKEEGINTTIATTIMKQNYAVLPEVVDLARQLGITTVMFQPFSQSFLCKNKKEEFWISDIAGLKESLTNAIMLSDKYSILLNHKDYLNNLPKYFLDNYFPDSRRCSIIKSSCAIDHEGNTYVCWQQRRLLLGNIKKESILNMWGSAKHKSILQAIHKGKCPSTCLMSCHERNFGKLKIFDPEFYRKINKILKNKNSKQECKQEIVKAMIELESVEQKIKSQLRQL